jgi:hypothetical protein
MRIPNWFVALIVVALVLCVAGVAVADEAKGKVVKAGDKEVVVKVGDKETTFTLGDKAKITIDGKEAKATDLKKDADVTVTFKVDGGKNVASEITSGKKP